MENLKWGIIGCGDVTEIKSGPAFSKVPHSVLHAVMRRDEAKARDYAIRHKVPRYYSNAADLINDPAVNAIYIATPPDSHEEYALAALQSGKPVYIEKPIALNQHSAKNIMAFAEARNVKLVVAHYRNAQPYFNKIKDLLDDGAIGTIMTVRLDYGSKAITAADLADPRTAWRLNPTKSGGGLFHDLAPHALGLLLYYFGEVEAAVGFSENHGRVSEADDTVTGAVLFKNKVHFTGSWCFNAPPGTETDCCEILGTKGKLCFTIFSRQQIILSVDGEVKSIDFEALQHVQQPMIQEVVNYFRGTRDNPCPPQQGYDVMKIMDAFTTK